MTNRMPRAVCPFCDGDVALTKDGRLRKHNDKKKQVCIQSGLSPDGLKEEEANRALAVAEEEAGR